MEILLHGLQCLFTTFFLLNVQNVSIALIPTYLPIMLHSLPLAFRALIPHSPQVLRQLLIGQHNFPKMLSDVILVFELLHYRIFVIGSLFLCTVNFPL